METVFCLESTSTSCNFWCTAWNRERRRMDRQVESTSQLLRERREVNQGTIVIVTHDRRFINPGDHILEIEDGRLKDQPALDEAFDDRPWQRGGST